jgi:hypothetical protein
MNARSLIARYTWLRGGDGDVDRGIELYAQELAARTAMLGPDDYRTRSIRACLATALRDRGTHDDLSRSLAMLREEVAHRSLRYGADHEFAGEARATLASTLLRLGEPALVTEALAIATELADGRRLRFGHHDARTLGAHLLRAHALLLASRRSAAEAEVRYVEAVARTGRDIVDRRWLEYLARAVRSQQEPAGDAVDPILVSRHLTQGQRRPGTGAGVH